MPEKLIFADADFDYHTSRFVLFGVPYDRTSSFRYGSRMAPNEIRKASYNFEAYSMNDDVDLKTVGMHDAGDIDCEANLEGVHASVMDVVSSVIGDARLPLMLGGEHSITAPAVSAMGPLGDIGVIVLDAHMDLRDEYLGERWGHACTSRRVVETTGVERYVSIGIRSASKEETEFAAREDLHFYTVDDVRSMGVSRILSECFEHIEVDRIYLSVDMDVLDPSFAPAVGNPEPFGLTSSEVRDFIRALSPHLVGFDLVEVAPEYDCGETALLAASLLRGLVSARCSERAGSR